jgi:hypothetical protein
MISLAWRTVLQMDGIEPSAQNMRAWSRGEGWGGAACRRMIIDG